ncbi:MAG: hypothetical protein Q4G11_05585 [Gallicola sp.]|nr:hypothetical protein [Gallicola sp.]
MSETTEKKKRKSVYDPEAQKRWNEKNRDKRRYMTDRTSARRFIKRAELVDVEELQSLLDERRKSLE